MSSPAPTVPDPVVIDSADGHSVTVTMVEGSTWVATAVCVLGDWDGSGWVVSLEDLAGNHADGSDGSR